MLNWVAFADFRSYSELRWSPDPGINILVGNNGAGKTNLLEGIAYLASLRSLRGAPDDSLVAGSAGSGVVRGEVSKGEGSALIEVEIRRKGGRRARLDGKGLQRTSDLFGVLRVVAFLPEDLDLIKGAPSGRRDLLDDLAVQLWPAAHHDQAEYERSLRQRNAYLKSGEKDQVTLDVWDTRLAQAGARLMGRRARAAAALMAFVPEAYSRVAVRDSRVAIEYESDWGGTLDSATPSSEWTAALTEALAARRRVDLELRLTGTGPHRDDPVLHLDGRPARHQASQGEQRTMALALRIAAHHAIADQIGTDPLLLLDDVFSELDPSRAEALTSALPGAQIMITTTRPEEVPLEGKVWRVEPGLVR